VQPNSGRPMVMLAAMRALALLSLALTASVAADLPASAAETGVPALLARLDGLHARRDDSAALAEAQRLTAAALAQAPNDYGVLWRAARVTFTVSDVPGRPTDERSRLGKQAYDYAQRAIAANPNDVAGYYWAVLGIGSYAEGMGVMRAIANGIEGKFRRPLERATALDESYDHGSIPVIWAAYYLELPWPKRDRDKAAQEIKRALAINPANLRARLYQARIYKDTDHPVEAKAELAQIAAAPVGRYDAPEERRVKKEAAEMAATLR
jgi:tetratricopeptide (TPR) repeat protein